MNKNELVAVVAAGTHLPRNTVEKVLDEAMAEIMASVAHGESVSLRGFGVFAAQGRQARVARNPRTNEPIPTPATTVVKFRPSKRLKTAVASRGVGNA